MQKLISIVRNAGFGLVVSCLVSSPALALSVQFEDEYEGGTGDQSFIQPFAENDNWNAMITRFGGTVKSVKAYEANLAGFTNFMHDSGVSQFDPSQIVTPPSPQIAKACKIKLLIPEQTGWIRGAALALWVQALAKAAGEKPVIENWYRNPCYNKAVGGVGASDHLAARAVDLDFASEAGRRRAQNWLCSFWGSKMNMQIGLGGRLIHLGAESNKGKRNWYYPTYTDKDKGRTCFDK